MIENKTDEQFILCKLRELPFQFFIKLLNIIRFSVDLIILSFDLKDINSEFSLFIVLYISTDQILNLYTLKTFPGFPNKPS